ncbi:GNAT family N-acetyltransferase [Halobacillus sp. ACCC02827]|uniref:GNAT family N-acetyltransferase n=1 Tax=Halobacillus sp. ACCC02827 TaxID=3052090 RepID=UPI002570E229|nr:GNAT family N-acetyltransferase [Halobacillus sp. ACCC02827]WJE14893.1 GNAT family N-acetyltransferase [Halobacillus sp. ACCC02827]
MNYSTASLKGEDLVSCVELFRAIFQSAPWLESWSVTAAEERLRDLMNTPKSFGLALYAEGKMIGFTIGNSRRTSGGWTFYIAEFCIDNRLQGRGAGSFLMRSLEEFLEEEGVSSINLLTSRAGDAADFYIKNGFVEKENRIVMVKQT